MKNIYILIGTRPNFIKVTRFKEFARDYNIVSGNIKLGQDFKEAEREAVLKTEFINRVLKKIFK